MTLERWLAFVGTVLLLMGTPGPSQLLMLSNSAGNGFRRALATAAGDLSANLLQMIVAGAGLAGAVRASSDVFAVVKWLGVLYLVFLGVRMWRAPSGTLTPERGTRLRSLRSLYAQGFVTSASNPKAVVFFAALFPQFLAANEPFLAQFAILSATYIVIDGTFLSLYGYGAAWIARRWNSARAAGLRRVFATLLIGAAILLGLQTADSR